MVSDIFIALGQEQSDVLSLTNESVKGGGGESEEKPDPEPKIRDKNITTELVFEGSMNPTSMVSLDENDILLLELVNGTVLRVLDGVLQPEPVLDVNVSKVTGERGMLGIAESKGPDGQTYVFLYYTEADIDGGTPIGNRLYRYEFVDNKLANPKLILDLPAFPGPYHNGGAITVGPDDNVYVPIGDLLDWFAIPNSTQAQNVQNGSNPNGSGGVLRITQNGKPVGNGILGQEYPLNLYYAYGIRNSFGIDFDPISGALWDTENGPGYGDEINLVEPGFNSGWRKVQGIWNNSANNHIGNVIEGVPRGLVDFNGKGNYSEPEFTWKTRGVGPTALKFLDSDKLGKEYKNDMFVGNVHNGNLYHFDLNENRTGLLLSGVLKDKLAENEVELDAVTIGQGFNGGITDLEVGGDGFLYIVSGIWGDIGRIYRLIPSPK
jgi:glucose/arabinose dehydrogenase